jgi:IS30 family transposase
MLLVGYLYGIQTERRLVGEVYLKLAHGGFASLSRDASSIYRDIKRNRYTDKEIPDLNGYHALVAQDKYEQRRAIHRKMVVNPELKEAIEERLKAGWSPEQIAG